VLSAIQDFRDEAYAAGNLRSDERQTITRADDTIEIKPADPQVTYVPYYEPERVVIYQPEPVYYYYPVAYPVYYYPYPAYHHFHTGFFFGVNTWFSIGWHSHFLHVYDPFYYGHPYYGHSYYHPFYVRNVYVNVNHYRYPNYVWEPRYRYGGRPVVRGSEGRVYTADRTPTPRRDANVARTIEGTVNRAREGAVAGSTRSQTTAERSTQATERASTRAQTPSGQTRGQTNQPLRNQAQARQPGDSTGAASAPPSRTRSGGGMSQALERSRTAAQPNPEARTSPGAARSNPSMARANPGVSPRASERSTGMPRQSSRSNPPPREQSAPPPRQQSNDGGSRGNSGGGSYRGGGNERSARGEARHTR
jgi:hypothetical protein